MRMRHRIVGRMTDQAVPDVERPAFQLSSLSFLKLSLISLLLSFEISRRCDVNPEDTDTTYQPRYLPFQSITLVIRGCTLKGFFEPINFSLDLPDFRSNLRHATAFQLITLVMRGCTQGLL